MSLGSIDYALSSSLSNDRDDHFLSLDSRYTKGLKWFRALTLFQNCYHCHYRVFKTRRAVAHLYHDLVPMRAIGSGVRQERNVPVVAH